MDKTTIFIILVAVLIALTVVQIVLMIINLLKRPALFQIGLKSKSKFKSLSGPKTFTVGNILESPDGTYKLMLQNDGKLVLESKHGDILWESDNNLSNQDNNCKATFSSSGHLVVWTKLNKEKLWHNKTDNNQGPYSLQLHNSGHLIVSDRNGQPVEQIFPVPNLG